MRALERTAQADRREVEELSTDDICKVLGVTSTNLGVSHAVSRPEPRSRMH